MRYRFYKNLIDFIISLTTNGSLPLQNTLCKNTFDCTLGGPFEYVYLTCSQLIRLSVKALERMYQAGLITESKGSAEAVQSLRNDSDTVEAWISEECSRVKGAKEERGKLYQKYVSYCDSTDRTSLSRNNFYRSLRMKDFREKMSMGIRYFEGISLEKSALKSALDDDEKCSEWTPVGDQMDLPFN